MIDIVLPDDQSRIIIYNGNKATPGVLEFNLTRWKSHRLGSSPIALLIHYGSLIQCLVGAFRFVLALTCIHHSGGTSFIYIQ